MAQKWCRRGLHRLEGDNLMRGDTRLCRACYNAWRSKNRRQITLCTACNLWFVDEEAWDAHKASPPGNPNAPQVCLSSNELRARGLEKAGAGAMDETRVVWRWQAWGDECRNGHPRTVANTMRTKQRGRYVRICRICFRATQRKYRRKIAAERRAVTPDHLWGQASKRKLSDDDVRLIRCLYRSGITTTAIADVFPLSPAGVANAVRGRTYQHIVDVAPVTS